MRPFVFWKTMTGTSCQLWILMVMNTAGLWVSAFLCATSVIHLDCKCLLLTSHFKQTLKCSARHFCHFLSMYTIPPSLLLLLLLSFFILVLMMIVPLLTFTLCDLSMFSCLQNDRLWRKNRSINQGSSCVGTDLNRNYDHNWSGEPSRYIYSQAGVVRHGPV